MPTLDIEIGGRPRTVSIPSITADELVVTVGDRHYRVAVAPAGASKWSIILLDRGHASHDVTVVEAGSPRELTVRLDDGTTFQAVVNGRRRHSAALGHSPSGEQRVAAPMPGRVVRMLVSVGDEVAARQPLVVIEAMKMENELRSPKAGRVKEVGAAAGAPVEAGRLLVVIE
jgi:biotin carboxyl carrier protein